MSDNTYNALGKPTINYNIKTTGINITLASIDSFSFYTVTSASVIVTLPLVSSVTSGWNVVIKNISSGTITVSAADLIDGNSSIILNTNQFLQVINTGSTFKVSLKSAPDFNIAKLSLVANTLEQGQPAPAHVKINGFVDALVITSGTAMEFSVPIPGNYNPGTDIELHWGYQSSTTTAGNYDWLISYQFQAPGTEITATPSTVTLLSDANPASIQLKDVYVTLPGTSVTMAYSLNLKFELTARPSSTVAHVSMFYLKYQSL